MTGVHLKFVQVASVGKDAAELFYVVLSATESQRQSEFGVI